MDPSKLEAQEPQPLRHASGITNNHPTNSRNVSHTSTPKSTLEATISSFTPAWFAIPMNTGVLSILMHQLPYQFSGLHVLATIMFLFELLLFTLMMLITLIRWTVYRKAAVAKTAGNIDEIAFLGVPPIAFLTLTALTALVVSEAEWGGHAWSVVAYVMWWVGTGWMFFTCIAVCVTIFRTSVTTDSTLSPSLVIPVVGVATAAVVGGLVCSYADDVSPRLAVPVIVTGYFLAGLAVWISIILYGMYFRQYMVVGWPEPAKRPSLLTLVGPFGQSAAAVQFLGNAALTKMDFAGYHRGIFLQAPAASILATASVFFALLLLGLDVFWLCCALAGVLEGAFKRQLSYSLRWWATIFPVSTMATAFLSLSITMDSPTFRVLCTGLFLILLIGYFINWGFTIWYSFRGDLLIKRVEDPGVPIAKVD